MSTLRLGRKAPDPTRDRLTLSQFVDTAALTYPAQADWGVDVTEWPMYGNDKYGDCVWAWIGHHIQGMTSSDGALVTVTEADVIKGYSDVTGFNPVTGANDDGTVMQDALEYWRKTGVGGHKIDAFYDVKTYEEALYALYNFGGVGVGINFPASAMDQFNQGKPWDVAKGSSIEGGHAIYGVAYPGKGAPTIVTWGQEQFVTRAFWDKYVEECWGVLSFDWFGADGKTPTGASQSALGAAWSALTRQPNPFPAPTPSPVPVPPPPAPAPDVDAVLAAALTRYSEFYAHPRYLLEAARAWLASR